SRVFHRRRYCERIFRSDQQHSYFGSDRIRIRTVLHHDCCKRSGTAIDIDDHEKGVRSMISRRTRRKVTNFVMFAITGICTFIAVAVLFFILGYLLWQGGHALNWDFFTKLPAPVGETGGGFAHAIVGSAKLLLLAALIGIPIGFLGGVYLAEFGGTTTSFVVRYTTDL